MWFVSLKCFTPLFYTMGMVMNLYSIVCVRSAWESTMYYVHVTVVCMFVTFLQFYVSKVVTMKWTAYHAAVLMQWFRATAGSSVFTMVLTQMKHVFRIAWCIVLLQNPLWWQSWRMWKTEWRAGIYWDWSWCTIQTALSCWINSGTLISLPAFSSVLWVTELGSHF